MALATGRARPGRKSKSDEQKRQVVIDQAWKVMGEFLNSPEYSVKEKAEMAKGICAKSMPQVIEEVGIKKVLVRHVEVKDRIACLRTPRFVHSEN